MDSITQATLGAAVGEAILGRRVGYKAPLIGAVIGTLPDLDVLANPFLTTVQQIYFHRSISHSFFAVIVAAPILGLLLNRYINSEQTGWKLWSKFSFWILFTHIFIDIPTTYGTQVFQPFSNYPLATDIIFIVDPLFTLPVLAGVILALFMRRASGLRLWINRAGLILGASYMLWATGIKAHVHSWFDAEFKNETGYYEKIKTMPNGPTTLFWTGFALKNDTLSVSTYSIFNSREDPDIHKIPRNSHLIEKFMETDEVEVVLWFSRGYYHVEETSDGFFFYDLRFGRSDFWITDNRDSEYVWSYKFTLDDQRETILDFEMIEPSFNLNSNVLNLYLERLL